MLTDDPIEKRQMFTLQNFVVKRFASLYDLEGVNR